MAAEPLLAGAERNGRCHLACAQVIRVGWRIGVDAPWEPSLHADEEDDDGDYGGGDDEELWTVMTLWDDYDFTGNFAYLQRGLVSPFSSSEFSLKSAFPPPENYKTGNALRQLSASISCLAGRIILKVSNHRYIYKRNICDSEFEPKKHVPRRKKGYLPGIEPIDRPIKWFTTTPRVSFKSFRSG